MRCWCWGWGWWPPRSTHGALARVGGERHEHVCGSGVHVGIREHDVGGLAPELEADGLEVGRGACNLDLAAGPDAAGEHDLADPHVAGHGLAKRDPTVHHVDQAGGPPSLLDQGHHLADRERGPVDAKRRKMVTMVRQHGKVRGFTVTRALMTTMYPPARCGKG